jgi:hypothetical protein
MVLPRPVFVMCLSFGFLPTVTFGSLPNSVLAARWVSPQVVYFTPSSSPGSASPALLAPVTKSISFTIPQAKSAEKSGPPPYHVDSTDYAHGTIFVLQIRLYPKYILGQPQARGQLCISAREWMTGAHEENGHPKIACDEPCPVPLATEEDLPICEENDWDAPAVVDK